MVDTLRAWANAQMARAAGAPMKTFDWVKAAHLIKDSQCSSAIAGLSTDMESTAGPIWERGKIVPEHDTDIHTHSLWATPVIVLDGGPEIECFIEVENKADTKYPYWPDEAREILET